MAQSDYFPLYDNGSRGNGNPFTQSDLDRIAGLCKTYKIPVSEIFDCVRRGEFEDMPHNVRCDFKRLEAYLAARNEQESKRASVLMTLASSHDVGREFVDSINGMSHSFAADARQEKERRRLMLMQERSLRDAIKLPTVDPVPSHTRRLADKLRDLILEGTLVLDYVQEKQSDGEPRLGLSFETNFSSAGKNELRSFIVALEDVLEHRAKQAGPPPSLKTLLAQPFVLEDSPATPPR